MGRVMSGKQNITEIVRWLEDLRASSSAIRSAGLAAGANQAAKDGMRTARDMRTLYVAPRGGRPTDRIQVAIAEGMRKEFIRRAG